MYAKSEYTALTYVFVCVFLWAYAVDRTDAHIHEPMCAMTRPRQGMPCSCLFQLMRQSQALIDSIYLALTLICQDAACQTASGPIEFVSQLQNAFFLLFLCHNKRVQTFTNSHSRRSPVPHPLLLEYALCEELPYTCLSVWLQGTQCWHLISGLGSFVFLWKYKISVISHKWIFIQISKLNKLEPNPNSAFILTLAYLTSRLV